MSQSVQGVTWCLHRYLMVSTASSYVKNLQFATLSSISSGEWMMAAMPKGLSAVSSFVTEKVTVDVFPFSRTKV